MQDSAPQKLVPPFTLETATKKVRLAEDNWNGQNPEKICLAYTVDTQWRNRSEFVKGRQDVIELLKKKWQKESNYRLIKELFAFTDNKIAVRFSYEFQDLSGNWFRAYGNENWEFDENGIMAKRHASINDVPISENERKFFWPCGTRRPDDHKGLSDLGL